MSGRRVMLVSSTHQTVGGAIPRSALPSLDTARPVIAVLGDSGDNRNSINTTISTTHNNGNKFAWKIIVIKINEKKFVDNIAVTFLVREFCGVSQDEKKSGDSYVAV